jgi:hypothetical protein
MIRISPNVTGDFNDDGLKDIAVLFYPQKEIKQSKQTEAGIDTYILWDRSNL